MENLLFVTADKVAVDLGISKPCSYKLVRRINDKLNRQGYFLKLNGIRISREIKQEIGHTTIVCKMNPKE